MSLRGIFEAIYDFFLFVKEMFNDGREMLGRSLGDTLMGIFLMGMAIFVFVFLGGMVLIVVAYGFGAVDSASGPQVSEFGIVKGGNIVIDPGSSTYYTGYYGGYVSFIPIITPPSVSYQLRVDVNGEMRTVGVTKEYFTHVNEGDKVEIIYTKGWISGGLYPKMVKDA